MLIPGEYSVDVVGWVTVAMLVLVPLLCGFVVIAFRSWTERI